MTRLSSLTVNPFFTTTTRRPGYELTVSLVSRPPVWIIELTRQAPRYKLAATGEALMTMTGPTHWSKDFVEHVRAVHFALALVSFALIITALNRTDVKLMKARNQIEQIADFEKKWTTHSVRSRLYRQALLDSRLPDHWFNAVALLIPKKVYTTDEINTRVSIPVKSLISSSKWTFEGDEMSSEMLSLSDFATFWNAAHGGFSIILPIEPNVASSCSGEITVTTDDSLTGQLAKFLGDSVQKDFLGDRPLLDCKYGAYPVPAFSVLNLPLAYDLEPSRQLEQVPTIPKSALLSISLPMPLSEISFHSAKLRSVTNVYQVLVALRPFKVDEQYISRLYFGPQRKGNFPTAFPELNDYAQDIGLLDINQAVHDIESLPLSNEQNLSVLGLSIALSQVSTWGALVLLVVQVYFLIHLRELVARIELSAEGWNVAWIGIYDTKLSATVAFMSACLLPVAAACVLAVQTYLAREKWLLSISLLVVIANFWIAALTTTKLLHLKRASLKA
jgi:hypothetical protein